MQSVHSLNTQIHMSRALEMLNLVKSHPIWATITIGVGTVVASEVLWRVYKYIRSKTMGKIHEVIIFNELGETCSLQHHKRTKMFENSNFDCPNKYCATRNIQRLIKQIDQAKYSIDIAIYTFTSIPLMEAFRRALQRGVIVRIISDREMVYSTGSQILRLSGYGVAVRGPESTCMMHHKFCILDGKARVADIMKLKGRKNEPSSYRSVLINGSVNWTKQGLGGNWENCYITSDDLLTETFQEEFERMWAAFMGAETEPTPKT